MLEGMRERRPRLQFRIRRPPTPPPPPPHAPFPTVVEHCADAVPVHKPLGVAVGAMALREAQYRWFWWGARVAGRVGGSGV